MNNIVDPLTNELHSIFSNHGTHLLKKYVTLLQNGGGKKYKRKKTRKEGKMKARETKNTNRNKNKSIKKLDQAQKKKKEKLERILQPVRDFISDSSNSDDFENNVIEPIIETAFMSPAERAKYLIEKKKSDKYSAFFTFITALRNSGAWIGAGTPVAMAKTAINSKSKSPFTRVLLFITAIILATNTIIGYVPLATKATEFVIDNYYQGRADSTHANLRGATYKPFGYNKGVPNKTTIHDDQWDFLNTERDNTLKENIKYLSGRPDLLYDSRNIEFVMKTLQESPASSTVSPATPSYPGTPERRNS